MSTLHFIRHGKATPGGATYDQLHPVGETQARLLGSHLRECGMRFDALYCGPLVRQRETYRLMREAAGEVGASWPEAVVLDELAEAPIETLVRHCFTERIATDTRLQAWAARFGDGRDKAAARSVFDEVFPYVVDLWVGGQLPLPGVESAASFAERVRGALSQIVGREGHGREVAVITSNGVIGSLVAQLRGDPDAPRSGPLQRYVNTSVTRFAVVAGEVRVGECNAYPHLRDAALHTFL